MDRSVIIDEKDSRGAGLKFLIVSLRYIGDVLLSTPLALSIKARYPDAVVDYAVFRGTEGILEKNRHVRHVHVLEPGRWNLEVLQTIWKKYDIAIGSNPSDRTCIFTAVAAKSPYCFSYNRRNEWWKKIFSNCRFYDHSHHIVPLLLTQLEPLGIPPLYRVVMGYDDADVTYAQEHIGGSDYVVMHPYARKEYKHWNPFAWRELARLVRRATGSRVIFTRSPDPRDDKLLESILQDVPDGVSALHRPYSLCQLAAALRASKGYVGVDTVVTHMAAALDVPTVALFGPTMVSHWGPWPNDSRSLAPYAPAGGIQRNGCITVVQKDMECVPCNMEECSFDESGKIVCLESLATNEVLKEFLALIG
ncbi:glycosyltransferase family 9 protein [Geobacter grbiciae]|uniref:glycosyltransferase family 9 protein n=1 Tax=Geobacter grbiciae TaxID=155042 RepID=UPI001C0100FE|nr:glycosyltransferase family 9 protein [Geobacter grbiciae]MBT1075994.1 glycosyltransferase family 9 protein [Geobacter grbiciae]